MDKSLSALKECIRLSAAGARGFAVDDSLIDWNAMLPIISSQCLTTMIACYLMVSSGTRCPQRIKENILAVARTMSSTNLIRKQRILTLISEMHSVGLKAYILKGYAVADIYAYPECRESVDTDVLIDREQEKRIYSFLAGNGFKIQRRRLTSHDGVCEHKKYGKVEIHVGLFNEIVEDAWFSGLRMQDVLQEDPITIETCDGDIPTLGYTDHLVFMTLHMVKHFISSGLTVRMMLDICLFFLKYRNEIDVKRFWTILERLHYAKFVNSVLGIMIQYGGFEPGDFPGYTAVPSDLREEILWDLLNGGYMGAKVLEARYDGEMEYNRRIIRKHKSALRYILYMVKEKIRSGAIHIFPNKQQLVDMYPILNQQPMLIPIFRVFQMSAFPIKKLAAGAVGKSIRLRHSGITEASKKRIELFEMLEMI